jgi:GNAT superfamily N-acetyltransferase
MAFHLEGGWGKRAASQNRLEKERRVLEGRAHAALVYDGSTPVGWCQSGPTAELRRIKNKRDYLSGLTDLPDWRITCFFVDRDRRREGVASAAIRGALREIAQLGEVPSKAIPKMLKIGRSQGPSSIMEPLPCSSSKGSGVPAAWARTMGW